MRKPRKPRAPREPRRQYTSYIEKLRDPRWQKKRLEIFERDSWSCLNCGATDKTLQVHHRTYLKGREPWEYDEENFETLCDECHKKATVVANRFKEALQTLDSGYVIEVLGYIQGMAMRMDDTGRTVRIETYEHAMGIGAAHGVTAEHLFDALGARGDGPFEVDGTLLRTLWQERRDKEKAAK